MNFEACNVHMLAFKLAKFRFSINAERNTGKNSFHKLHKVFFQLHSLPHSVLERYIYDLLASERKVFMHFRFSFLFSLPHTADAATPRQITGYLIFASRCNPIRVNPPARMFR